MTRLDNTAARLIKTYGLSPHPEGGFYRETYRSRYSTAIYYLLPEGARSLLHRIGSDELFHFYLGGPLTVSQIAPDGSVCEIVMGSDFGKGQVVQHVIAAGTWFGACPNPGSGFSLVGCTVAPGFKFSDFELGRRPELLALFPKAKAVIERLTEAGS